MPYRNPSILTLLVMILLISWSSLLKADNSSVRERIKTIHNYVVYYPDDRPAQVAEYDLALTGGGYTAEQVAAIKTKGTLVVAYLSVGEINPKNDPRDQQALQTGQIDPSWVLGYDKDWNANYMDATQPGWRDIVLARAGEFLANGYDGLFLDVVSVVDLDEYSHTRPGMIELLRQLREKFPNALLIQNGGTSIIETTVSDIDAYMLEDLGAYFDFDKQVYQETEQGPYAQSFIDVAEQLVGVKKRTGLVVLALGYAPPDNPALARHAIDVARQYDFLPSVSISPLNDIPQYQGLDLTDTSTLPIPPRPSRTPTPPQLSALKSTLDDCTLLPAKDKPALYDPPYVDPTFGTTLVRITTPPAAGETGSCLTQMYPKQQAWNADNSKLLLISCDSYWHLLDGNTYHYLEKLTDSSLAPPTDPNLNHDVRWHTSDSDIFYYFSANKLMKYSVSAKTGTLLKAFEEKEGVPYVAITMGEEGNYSDDMRYVAFVGCNGTKPATDLGCGANQTPADLVVYDIQTGEILAKQPVDLLSETHNLDWVGMSPSGNYVLVSWVGGATDGKANRGKRGYGTEAYDRQLHFVRQVFDISVHGDVGYDVNGDDIYVSQGWFNPEEQTPLLSVRLRDGGMVETDIPLSGRASGFHVSMRGLALPGWAEVSTHDEEDDINKSRGVLVNEVFAVKLDGSNEVRRIAHTQSIIGKDNNYTAQPRASVNRNFTKVVFASNWRELTGRVDSYVIDLSHPLQPQSECHATGSSSPAPTTTPVPTPQPAPVANKGSLLTSECLATYSAADGMLHVPCVQAPGPMGGVIVYDVYFQQQFPNYEFVLDLNSVKPR